MRYRKKPIVVEAKQYHGASNGLEICDWVNAEGGEAYTNVSGVKGVPTLVEIETLEGTMRAEPGDWIVRGVKGEFYPCKPDIFEATYEPAQDSDALWWCTEHRSAGGPIWCDVNEFIEDGCNTCSMVVARLLVQESNE